MAENLASKGKLVWFGLSWFSLVWFLIMKSVREVLVSIHTKPELYMCLMSPTIEINVQNNVHSIPFIIVRKLHQI